ncbi:MAG: hypothetical protein H0X29_05220 [Parachlamydiaceae bacterium]|nr:hypothetical protein [Parachlamydiaceae bacterium]
MTASVAFHASIERYNVLKNPTSKMNAYFKKHPALYKTALLVNHAFRTISMASFSQALPFTGPINTAICFSTSLFYRISVEKNCAYKFALPAFAGSLTIPLAYSGLESLISRTAFISLSAFSLTMIILIPPFAYLTYIILTVQYDVDSQY